MTHARRVPTSTRGLVSSKLSPLSSVLPLLLTLGMVGCGSEGPSQGFESSKSLSASSLDANTAAPMDTDDEPQAATDSRQGNGILSLSDATNSYCPPGSRLDSKFWLCIQGSEALGPFPPAMISACESAGGGAATCASSRWNADFARRLRGSEDCPKGTQLDTKISQCAADDDVYGPFSNAFVQACLDMTAGSSVCQTQRVHRMFAEKFVSQTKAPPSAPAAPSMPGDNGQALQVPYFYQYANTYEPGRTCNITSVAMVARYLGVNTTPDQIYRLTNGPVFTGDAMVWAARKVGLNGTFSATGSIKTIKSYLDAGSPVILQGWFTKSGHVLVITGYDAQGWIVNDPAGKWDGCYKCGYNQRTSTNGRAVRYSYDAMERAATDPGNPNSYYITVLRK